LDRGVSDSDAGAFGAAGDWDRFGWSCLFAPAAGASRVVALESSSGVGSASWRSRLGLTDAGL
jgi:hypothetical protein